MLVIEIRFWWLMLSLSCCFKCFSGRKKIATAPPRWKLNGNWPALLTLLLMWRVIKRVVRNTSAPKHAMSLFKNLDSSLVRLKFFSCETGSNFIILYMFCQEATDFCITLESKSTSPAPKFSNKSNCLKLQRAQCLGPPHPSFEMSSPSGGISFDRIPLSHHGKQQSGGAGVSFYCSTQTGEDHRYVWTLVPAVGWAVDVEIHRFGLLMSR